MTAPVVVMGILTVVSLSELLLVPPITQAPKALTRSI
jgi:hypothetical protein